jgi:hypothetical protein
MAGHAREAQPGDEVVYVDARGEHHAAQAECLIFDIDRVTVRLITPVGERVLDCDQPVMLIRGLDRTPLSDVS